jgi:hypothetical protein
MPRSKDLKRLVRSRMQKTGESYTTARAQLREKSKRVQTPARGTASLPSSADFAALAGMSDDAVRAKTGRTWKQWVRVLDAIDASAMPHRDIARHVHEEHDIPGWWAQTVTVGYERIRGLREVGQRRSGAYETNKSKTVPVSLTKLYRAFSIARTRNRWLPGVKPVVRKAAPEKSLRFVWEDGSAVHVYFTAKGTSKAQVAVQHTKLPTKAAATKMKEYWGERLGALADILT